MPVGKCTATDRNFPFGKEQSQGIKGKTICVVEKVKNEMPYGWCQMETFLVIDD